MKKNLAYTSIWSYIVSKYYW